MKYKKFKYKFDCPKNIAKNIKECREKRVTYEYPNGKSESGLYNEATHPKIIKVNCMCITGFLDVCCIKEK